jgi:hypothetical protein
MPIPTTQLLDLLGPAVLPFERRGFDRDILEGEDVNYAERLYDATDDGLPEQAVCVPPKSILENPKYGRYLWVITANGMHIILEATPNPNAARKVVCHSNITGGAPALQGGELWFGTDNKVYINYRSGRYGAINEAQMEAVVAYFGYVGYEEVVVVD